MEAPLLDRPQYSATEVRRRIVEGANWKELVPGAVTKEVQPIIRKGRFNGLE